MTCFSNCTGVIYRSARTLQLEQIINKCLFNEEKKWYFTVMPQSALYYRKNVFNKLQLCQCLQGLHLTQLKPNKKGQIFEDQLIKKKQLDKVFSCVPVWFVCWQQLCLKSSPELSLKGGIMKCMGGQNHYISLIILQYCTYRLLYSHSAHI